MAEPTLQANFSANTAGFSQGVSELKQKLNELNTAMEQNKLYIKEANAEIRQYQKELQQLETKTKNGTTATDEQKQRMQELRDKIAQTISQLGTMRTAQQDLQREIRNANSQLRDQGKELEEVDEELEDVNEDLEDGAENASTFGEVLKATLCSSAIQTALSKLTQSLKQAAQYCYNVGSSFEAGMSQVEAISGATSAELEKLTQKAKDLGAATKFTASEVAEAMNYMAMAGWDANQMLDGIDGVISLAAASGEDLGQVSDIVTDAITAFGLAAEDVDHFSDVLAAASAASNTNVGMMGETFKYCAPLAGAMAFSIEDVSEAIGIMANSGIKSTMAGTALRTLLTQMSNDIKITGDAIGEVTIKTSNADGSMRGLTEILTDMRAAWAGLTESERSAEAESIAGKNAMSGFLALMNAGESDVQKLRTAIEECDGASAQMAETMQQNVAGSVVIMQSAMEGLGIAVYDHFGENLKTFVDDISDVFSSLTERVISGELGDALDKLSTSLGAAGEDLIELAADVLPDVIEGIANFLTVAVNLREEIAAGVTAFATYKAAALGLTLITKAVAGIKTLVTAIKAAAAETNIATAAWKGFTAAIAANPIGAAAVAISAVVSGITLLNSHLDDCNEKMSELNDNAKKLTKSSEEYADSADDLRDVKERYEDIENSADDAATKEEKLKELQDELIDNFGAMADGINLVTGAFDTQSNKLDTLIKKYDELSERDREYALAQAEEAEKEKTTLKVDHTAFNSVDNAKAAQFVKDVAEGLVGTYDGKFGLSSLSPISMIGDSYGTNLYFSGTYEQRISDLNIMKEMLQTEYEKTRNKSYVTYVDRIDELLEELQEGKATKDALTKTGSSASISYVALGDGSALASGPQNSAYFKTNKSSSSVATTTGDAKDLEEQYDNEKKYLKWRLDMGYITEADYYSQLATLRDKYLDETSDKWRSATLEIHKYQVSKNGDTLDEIKKQYNNAISAIDDEIKQHNRELEDEDIEQQIADVEKQLQYDRLDEYSRQQLERKKQDLLDEKEETEWQRQKADEKEMLGTVYTMAKEAYDQGTADLNSALQTASAVFNAIGTGAQQTASTVSTVNNNSVNMIMNAVSQTSEQIAAAVIRQLSSGI